MASAVFSTNAQYPNWLVDVICLKWLRNILFYHLTYWLNNTSFKYPLRMKMANEIMRGGKLLVLLSYIVFSYQFPCIDISSDIKMFEWGYGMLKVRVLRFICYQPFYLEQNTFFFLIKLNIVISSTSVNISTMTKNIPCNPFFKNAIIEINWLVLSYSHGDLMVDPTKLRDDD